MLQNAEQLRLPAIFHDILGGLAALLSLIPLGQLLLASFIFNNIDQLSGNSGAPAAIGLLFAVMASILFLLGITLAVCCIAVGRFLGWRSHYMFCLVIAGIECLLFPFGTALGSFSIIVLVQEPVKQMFQPTSV